VGIGTLILGIGNLLLRDEGVGVHAVRALRERFELPEDVEVIDGGTMGLDLLPFIEGRDAVLLVDAVDFREAPGTVRVVEGKDLKSFLDMKFSVHQVGLPDMLVAASLMGISPPRVSLVGIQPHTIATGLELSPELEESFPSLLTAIGEKLRSWGVVLKEKADVPRGTL
jgi:hydrogenase maturation protease